MRESLVFCKQKTAYEVRISDWSSDVCSSDLDGGRGRDDFYGGARGGERPGRRGGYGRGPRRNEVGFFGDLRPEPRAEARIFKREEAQQQTGDRKSAAYGKRMAGRVDLGGRRTIKKKQYNTIQYYT